MNTDKITENLCEKAVKDAREQLVTAANNYHKAINLSGTSEIIRVEGSIPAGSELAFDKEGNPLAKVEVRINSRKLTEAITENLMKIRDKKIRSQAVTDFLNKFEQFGEYMHQMENMY